MYNQNIGECQIEYDCSGEFAIKYGDICLSCEYGWMLDTTKSLPLCTRVCNGFMIVQSTVPGQERFCIRVIITPYRIAQMVIGIMICVACIITLLLYCFYSEKKKPVIGQIQNS